MGYSNPKTKRRRRKVWPKTVHDYANSGSAAYYPLRAILERLHNLREGEKIA